MFSATNSSSSSNQDFLATSDIVESKYFSDILSKCSRDSFVLLDLDNTVIETKSELGSDQWFVSFISYASTVVTDTYEASSLVISIYNAVQHHVEMKTVEHDISHIIKFIQERGIPVVALTARNEKVSAPTLSELKKLDISFTHYEDTVLTVDDVKRHVVYKDGVIFCDGYDKGKCLDAFFMFLKISPNVVMVDDKRKHLESVKKIIDRRGNHFSGLRYGYLDEVVARFNMTRLQVATEHLIELKDKLPNDAKMAMHKLNVYQMASHSLFKSVPVGEQETTKENGQHTYGVSHSPVKQ